MGNSVEKKDLIVETARKLFSAYGYKRVSMDEIAAGAGVAKGTIYLYFKNKDALFRYFVEEDMQQMEKIIKQTEKTAKSFFEELHKGLLAVMEYRKTSQLIANIMYEAEGSGSASVMEYVRMMNGAVIGYIQRRLENAVTKGEVRDCNIHAMAFLIFKMYMVLTYDREKQHNHVKDQELLESISILFEEGLAV